jgi:hypothetical protein
VEVGQTREEAVDVPFKELLLIVCEGETEAAYFEVLARKCHWLQAVVLPQKAQKEPHKGASVRGLLETAYENRLHKNMPFEHIWIVTDHDEGNAYKLDEPSLQRIEEALGRETREVLARHQCYTMRVRAEEEAVEGQRIRYFLCADSYRAFLGAIGLDAALHEAVISLTAKKDDFDQLYERRHASFPKIDPDFLQKVQVAYSCIAFEHWLLLHFELNVRPFYNSREIIHYFDEKGYFIRTAARKREPVRFDKGWDLLEWRALPEWAAFFNDAEKAMRHALVLAHQMQPQIALGKKHYEINPYTDVYRLAGMLLQERWVALKMGYLDVPISHHGLANITVEKKASAIRVSFRYERESTAVKRLLLEEFSIQGTEGQLIEISHSQANARIDTGDSVVLEMKLPDENAHFLYHQFQKHGSTHAMVWFIGEASS